jgi:hypothetical protein
VEKKLVQLNNKGIMKTILSIITLIICSFLIGCGEVDTDDSSKADVPAADTTKQITALTDITTAFKTNSEAFNIDPTKDTLIKCAKGTLIYLPANCLEDENGQSPKGMVQLNVKECYSISDFIGDNLTTTSGDQILETAGMVNISISSEEQQLAIKDGKEYALYFPKNSQQEDMQLFYGNRNTEEQIDWDLALDVPDEGVDSLTVPIDSSLISCGIYILGWAGPADSTPDTWELMNSTETIFTYFDKNFKPSKKMESDFCSNNYRVTPNISINSEGKIEKIDFEPSTPTRYDQILADFLYQVPPLNMDKTGRTYTLVIGTSQEPKSDLYKKQFEGKYASFKDKAIAKVDQAELNYYVQSATKFGWINCDRFWDTPDEKIEFFVNTQSPNDAKVYLVFKEVNSIMQGQLSNGKLVFKNIPVNQPVKVIGISFNKGKPTMAKAETTTNKDGFDLTTFNEFYLDQLEAELNSMD